MQVKTKFKQTEAGLIPEEWQVKKLSEISPSQSVGLVINPSTYYDTAGTVPLLVGSNIHENYIEWESANRITNKSNKLLPASRLVAGDLVTVRVGEPGVTAVVPGELDGCNCASMMIVRQHRRFDSYWLCYMMNSKLGRSRIEDVQYGTAQKQFNIRDAINFRYPVPPLQEQRAIATALSDVDAIINSLDRLIAKKRNIKQATMQQLLTGKTRLPGFKKKDGFKQTEIGLVPEDWFVSSLSTLSEKIMVGIASAATHAYRENGVVLIRNQNIKAGYLDDKDLLYVDPAYELTFKNKRLRTGDLLTARTGYPGTTCAVPGEYDSAQSFTTLITRPKSQEIDNVYLCYYINSQHGQAFFEQNQIGGGQKNVNAGSLKRMPIAFPSCKQEQNAIATALSDIDADLTTLEQRRNKTLLLKQGMMQELLTGRTRLV